MKLSTKIGLGLALLCLMPGLVLIVVGLSMGGSWRQALQYTNTGYSHYVTNKEVSVTTQHQLVTDASLVPQAGIGYDLPAGIETATRLDFELDGVRWVNIETGSEYALYVDTDVPLQNLMEGDTWKLKTRQRAGFNSPQGSITIVVPKSTVYKQIDLEIGAGELNASQLLAETLDAQVGAGAIYINQFSADYVELQADAGSLEATGSASRACKLEAKAGSVYLTTPQPANYGYDVECNVGTVQIGTSEFTGLSTREKYNLSAPVVYQVECSAGSAVIDFE